MGVIFPSDTSVLDFHQSLIFLVTMRAVNGQPGPPGPVNIQVYD